MGQWGNERARGAQIDSLTQNMIEEGAGGGDRRGGGEEKCDEGGEREGGRRVKVGGCFQGTAQDGV